MLKYGQLSDPEWLAKEIENKPLRQVADEVGCSYSAVVYQVRKFGLTVPKRFTRRQSPDKSENIKKALRERYPEGRFGKNASNWRGGRRKMKSGYVMVYMPEHPRAKNSGAVFEHIVVAEKKIGRPIYMNEVVHHINHVKDDNRPENLEVMERGAHLSNHFNEPIKLQKENARLKALLKANGIDYT